MNWYRKFFLQTPDRLPTPEHALKLTDHEKYCMQDNQLPNQNSSWINV